ncbi:hypothetical protein PoB_001579600 [Plakobranchus ocellatus]|uniref:Uncharacterized protein n=1 Tax=Plakobranchus ocellatus TaxID=259542 RepID=A0AAV3Z3Y4_9GAST|nr:hypothetical protein PoB_001579600 [Plakobranchus ocellatus]
MFTEMFVREETFTKSTHNFYNEMVVVVVVMVMVLVVVVVVMLMVVVAVGGGGDCGGGDGSEGGGGCGDGDGSDGDGFGGGDSRGGVGSGVGDGSDGDGSGGCGGDDGAVGCSDGDDSGNADLHEEWWFYLLAGLLGLIALVLLLSFLCWCCCGPFGCCSVNGTVYPHADATATSTPPHRRCCWCRYCCGMSCECCCRKRAPDCRQNASSKGVYWIDAVNGQSKYEPGSPCAVCTRRNPLGSSGLSSNGSPHSGHGPVRTKNISLLQNNRGTPPINDNTPAGAHDHSHGSSRSIEMYGGGGQGLASVETPPPREVQLHRPVKPAKEPAKEAKIWMPHSNPIRPINTSTK